MREGTAVAQLHPLTVYRLILILARAMLQGIQRAVAEKTIQFLHALMAGIIFTLFVFKKTVRIFHMSPHFKNAFTHSLISSISKTLIITVTSGMNI